MSTKRARIGFGRNEEKPTSHITDGCRTSAEGAFSILLREHREKNRGLLVAGLKDCQAFHVIFCQIYTLDMIAQYASMYFREYAQIPTEFHRIPLPALCRDLIRRPQWFRHCDQGRRRYFAIGPNTLYWNATSYIMKHMKIGQLGYFSKKGYGFKQDCCHPFIVTWIHPDAALEEEEQCIPIIGVIFPALLGFDTIPIRSLITIPFWWQALSMQKSMRLGGDTTMLHAQHANAVSKITAKCTCRHTTTSPIHHHHHIDCPYQVQYLFESERLRQHDAYRTLPSDQYYKVHYFAFWAEAPNQSGTEVSQSNWTHRVKIFDTTHELECHFVDNIQEWPPAVPQPDLHQLNPSHFQQLPFHFNPYSINNWKE